MAMILNEAYSVLSDPISRMAYDKEQEKFSELRGYTGRPLYSAWLGSETEERAVFVDEVKCVGCLKCALLAEKTFAVESVYGRARVVAQWADPENKIQEAIDACPVDCISTVQRSNLAALEFLMSKEQRGNVRIGASNAAAGGRVSNIFVDVEKFQSRFHEASLKEESKVSDARMSAIGAIRSISNWLYWQSPGSSKPNIHNLTIVPRKSTTQPNIKKLQEAVKARKQSRTDLKSPAKTEDDYWTPIALSLPSPPPPSSLQDNVIFETVPIKDSTIKSKGRDIVADEEQELEQTSDHMMIMRASPVAAAAIAAVIVRLQAHEGAMVGQQIKEHVGGSIALGMVNSDWQPVVLAAVVWYLIAGYSVELLQPFIRKLIKIYKIRQ